MNKSTRHGKVALYGSESSDRFSSPTLADQVRLLLAKACSRGWQPVAVVYDEPGPHDAEGVLTQGRDKQEGGE